MPKKILIEGEIGWEVDNESVRDQLESANGEDVVVHIASPGGFISEGLKIYNTLKNYEGNVDTHLTGSVASMATYIAMVGKNRTAEKNAVFMIHNGSGLAIGDHNVMFKFGKHLDSLSNMVAKEYAVKSDTPLADIRTAMDETTFYYGDEIKDAGFVHEMIGDAEPEDKAEAIAKAELMFSECQAKINTPDMVKKEMTALSTMMAKEPIKPSKPGQPDNNKLEDKMDLEKLKAEHPALYAQIVASAEAEGLKKGIEQERARCKNLTDMRAKFPKDHSKAVIDTAISEGHEMADVSINLMAADQTNAELEAAKKDEKKTPANAATDIPEMVDGEMTHTDHVDAQSDAVAKALGIKK